jgi:hypothetical protein
MTSAVRSPVKCRLIEDADRERIADRLAREFPSRSRKYWLDALQRMGSRTDLEDFPKYGLLLESEGEIVGVLLQIYFRRGEGAESAVYCNLSSWCMDPRFRGYAPMLSSAATKRKDVTYLNISPAPHTRVGIEALGFRRYCDGQLVCFPALSVSRRRDVKIVAFRPEQPEAMALSSYERRVLAAHETLGCRVLIATAGGESHPFVFMRRRVFRRLIPCEQLIYCRSLDDFVAFAGPLGRYLLARGGLISVADANGPLPGVIGYYLPDNGPKYFKGAARPNLGDLSFTELPVLGP